MNVSLAGYDLTGTNHCEYLALYDVSYARHLRDTAEALTADWQLYSCSGSTKPKEFDTAIGLCRHESASCIR